MGYRKHIEICGGIGVRNTWTQSVSLVLITELCRLPTWTLVYTCSHCYSVATSESHDNLEGLFYSYMRLLLFATSGGKCKLFASCRLYMDKMSKKEFT